MVVLAHPGYQWCHRSRHSSYLYALSNEGIRSWYHPGDSDSGRVTPDPDRHRGNVSVFSEDLLLSQTRVIPPTDEHSLPYLVVPSCGGCTPSRSRSATWTVVSEVTTSVVSEVRGTLPSLSRAGIGSRKGFLLFPLLRFFFLRQSFKIVRSRVPRDEPGAGCRSLCFSTDESLVS